MSLSDLILLIIVIAFFARKIYQKKKGKGMKNIVKQSQVSQKVDVWKHILNIDTDIVAEDLEVFINKNLQRYSEQGIQPDVEYKINNNVFFMIVIY